MHPFSSRNAALGALACLLLCGICSARDFPTTCRTGADCTMGGNYTTPCVSCVLDDRGPTGRCVFMPGFACSTESGGTGVCFRNGMCRHCAAEPAESPCWDFDVKSGGGGLLRGGGGGGGGGLLHRGGGGSRFDYHGSAGCAYCDAATGGCKMRSEAQQAGAICRAGKGGLLAASRSGVCGYWKSDDMGSPIVCDDDKLPLKIRSQESPVDKPAPLPQDDSAVLGNVTALKTHV